MGCFKATVQLVVGFEEGATGLGFDVTKGIITASDEWWEDKIAVSKIESCLFFLSLKTKF